MRRIGALLERSSMNRLLLLACAASMTVSCSRGAAPPAPAAAPAPKPLTAGVDVAGFDNAVRPQDDLYRRVNGVWLQKTEIPPDRGSYGGSSSPPRSCSRRSSMPAPTTR
jgi:hypothetical protein